MQSCKDLDGTPNADAVLSVDDLNGDGGEDWIADYAKLKCDGGINQMCGDERLHAANLPVGRSAPPGTWRSRSPCRATNSPRARGKRVLQVVMAGAACDKPSNETCNLTFRLDKTAIVPVP